MTAKKKTQLTLPQSIEVSDYHEFDSINDLFKQIGLKVKVKEIGFYDGYYTGIVYTGRLTDPENAKLVKQLKEEDQDY